MNKPELNLTLQTTSATEQLTFTVNRLVCAGWVGKDRAALQAHIEELAHHGIPGPGRTPIYMNYSAYLATTEPFIDVVGPDSSGEVEYVILKQDKKTYIGVGSDHTDREMEKHSIPGSKQMCAKVLAPVIWPYEEVQDHWDQIIIRSWTRRETDRVLYQEDTLGTILDAESILNGLPADDGLPIDGMLVFSGTVSTKIGLIFSDRFDFEMQDPVLKRSIQYGYDIRVLPQYL
ncbi:MAG: DUF2848 family protein [Deltaproteobacteria bacterium]|nr:DUF2848 family protein [Deltaproteobacteria bacterium]MBW1995250.1 DUF2848 family protein [Deltaproteobacteria bacterium]MBW2152443.1 DUF2848 family protein [Deltaproteobacteria bacterium]